MRTLACSFLVNGVSRQVALRKREKKFQVVIKGDLMEYTLTPENTLTQVTGPVITEPALFAQIEWMIRNYFA